MASSMIAAAAAAAASASASSAATAELKIDEEDGCNEEGEEGVLNSSSRSCANDPDFAVICVFLQRFYKDLGVAKPNFKNLQEWLTNTDEVSNQLRDLHIKLLRKTRRTVHEKSWESSLSKFCFTYSAQDAWEIERFGYKKSSLKVKLRILKELLESQFQRNGKFRAHILTMSADSLRSQPIGRDRLGHTYYFTQDDDANLRIYQEHLDEDIWQVVATTREELVNLISRLRGNEVVISSTDIGVDEDTSSSNSCTGQVEKPPPPVEQDDSQEEEARIPNLRIKLSNNGKLTVSSPTITAAVATKRNLDAIDKSSPRSEELNIIKKARPSLLDVNRTKKPSRYEKTKSEEEDEEDDNEEDEEELSIEEEDIDSAAAEEDENEEKEIEDTDSDDEDNGIGEAIEEPPVIIRGEGSGNDSEGGNINMEFFANTDMLGAAFSDEETGVGEAVEEDTLYVYGEGSGSECLVGNGKNDDTEAATTTTAIPPTLTPTPTTPTKTCETKATFFFGEPGCLKLSPIKPTPTGKEKDLEVVDDVSNTADNKTQSDQTDTMAIEKVKETSDVEMKNKNEFMNASNEKDNNKDMVSTCERNNGTNDAVPEANEDSAKVTSNGEDVDCGINTLQEIDQELEKCHSNEADDNSEKCGEELEKSDEPTGDEKIERGEENLPDEKLDNGNAPDEKLKSLLANAADEKLQGADENEAVEKQLKGDENVTDENLNKGEDRTANEMTEKSDEKREKCQENAADEKQKKIQENAADKKQENVQENASDEHMQKCHENAAKENQEKSNDNVDEEKLETKHGNITDENIVDEMLENSLENIVKEKLEKSIEKAADESTEVNHEYSAGKNVADSAKADSGEDKSKEQKIEVIKDMHNKGNISESDNQSEESATVVPKKVEDTKENDLKEKEDVVKDVDDQNNDTENQKADNEICCTSKGTADAEENESMAKKSTNKVDENEVMVAENVLSDAKRKGEEAAVVEDMPVVQERLENKNSQTYAIVNSDKCTEQLEQEQKEQEKRKHTKEQNKPVVMTPTQSSEKYDEHKLPIINLRSSVEEKFDCDIANPSTFTTAQSIVKASTSISTSTSIIASNSTFIPSSTPPTHSIGNRKRRLEDMPPPTLHRLSTSESEVDLHSEQHEEVGATDDNHDPADVGGKRLKMRPKLTNTELRKKVEAQKGHLEETTSSSGEEDARRRRKIIPPRRQIERCVKNLKVAHEAAAAKREINLAQAVKAENALVLTEENDALPLNLTSPTTLAFPAFPATPTAPPFGSTSTALPTVVDQMPPPAPMALATSILGSAPVPTATPTLAPVQAPFPPTPTIRQKPTLAEIIEKKLKKTSEQADATALVDTSKAPLTASILTSALTAPVTSKPTNDANAVAIFSPPKKTPITKPLKKNLLTQIRQEESDEDSIPRKRTISDASASAPTTTTATTKTEIVKKLESFVVEDCKEKTAERKIPDRKIPQSKTTERKSVERKLPIRKMPDRKTPERKTPERQRKRRSSEEVKTTSNAEPESSKEMKYETLEEQETKVETVVIEKEKSPSPVGTAVVGRRSSRRSAAAAVIYTELPQPKRTRAGAKATTTTTATDAHKKANAKEEKRNEVSKGQESTMSDDNRAAPSTKQVTAAHSTKQVITTTVTTIAATTKEVSKENAKEAKKSKQTPKPTKTTKKDSKKEAVNNEKEESKIKPELKKTEVSTPVKSVKESASATTTVTATPADSVVKISPTKTTTPEKNTTDGTPISARGRGMRSKLEVDTTNIIETIDSETPVRQSRRIAQQKIREEAERRKLEEIALRTMKQELKKKKKAEKQSDPTVVEPSEASSSEESEVELKKKTKKKCPGKDGWSSGSEEQEEPEEDDEPPQESDHGSPLFRSDHEFSPESDLEDDTHAIPMKRARTARKENAEEGDERDEEACQKCGKSDHPEWILLCDNCDKGYHCSCLSPVLFYIPEGDWYCPPCQQEQLIAALEKQLNDFDEFVEQKRLQEVENKRLAAEAERVEQERLENEKQQQQELKERKRQKKKNKHRGENGKEGDDDKENGTSASSDGEATEEKSKKRGANESDDDSDDDKPLVRKGIGNRKFRTERKRDSHKRRRGDGRSRRRAAARGIATRRRQRNTSDSGTGSGSAHVTGSGSGDSSRSGSSSSSSSSLTDSDDEPIYKLRKRRQINVSYRLNEYDDLINSALKKEMDELAGAGNLGRGKDISTIIEADKEEKSRKRQLEKETCEEKDEETKAVKDEDTKTVKQEDKEAIKDEETKAIKDEDTKAVKAEDSEVPKERENIEDSKAKTDDDESSDEVLKRKAKPKATAKKKKPRKLTTLDISSEDDNASDEDFKTSSFEDDEEEDTSISASTASDSSLEIFRRRGKKNKKQRKAARRAVRQRRKDRRFVVDDSDYDEEEARPKSKKKKNDDLDYSETDTDSEASENLEDVDSADLCDDTTSESDGAWYPSKRKKQRKGGNAPSVGVARKSPKLKKQPVKKTKRVEYSDDDISESEEEEDDDDDDITGGKGSGKQPRSQPLKSSNSTKGKGKGKGKGKTTNSKKKKKQSDDEDSLSDSEDSTRRTRGRRYAYLEDFDDESSDGGIKPGVKRPDTPPEERQKFIQKQEEIKRMLAEKNAEGAKLAATPRLTPIKADGDKDKRSPAKLSDSLSTVPLSVIRQAKVLDAEYLQRKESIAGDSDHVDEVDEFDDADLPDDFPEDMDEDTIARMVEEEEELSAAAAARELPPPDEVVRTPTKQATNKPKEAPLALPTPALAPAHATPVAAAAAAAAIAANLTASASAVAVSAHGAPKPSLINPSLAALAQMPGGVGTAAAAAAAAAAVHHMSSMASGLQEPMRKRLPMPTMHPPLLRHQFPPHGANMPLAHLLQRHPSAPPPTHLLQNALNTPLGQPLNRSSFPPQHLPRLPAGMSMEQMLAAQHIMSAAAAARHNLPPTSQHLPSASATRETILSSAGSGGGGGAGNSGTSVNSGAVAAAIAAATAVAAASGANKPQSEPKPRGRRKKITPLRDTLQKQQTAAAVTAATTQSDKPNEPPSNSGAGGVGGGVIKSASSASATAPPPPQLYKQQGSGPGGPSVSSAPVSQASVITRMPQIPVSAAHASVVRAMSNLYPGADVARFFAPPTSLSGVTGPRPPPSMQRHRDAPGMQGLPHSAGMRQSYGPPPPLRGSGPNHGQPPQAGSGERPTYHAPGDLHMPSGMGASMYGGPPPPARHSTSHLNPYRPTIYGNPNFVPRGPGVPNLRVPGSGGPEFGGGPRSYSPYGYYPPPPPLTNPHAPPMQRPPQSSTAATSRGSSATSSAAAVTTQSPLPSTISAASKAAAITSASASASTITAATTKTNITTAITTIAKPSSVIVAAPPSNASAARNIVTKSPIPTPTITPTPTQTPIQITTPKITATSTPPSSSTSTNSISMPSRVIVTEPAVSVPVAAIVNSNKGPIVTATVTATVVNESSAQPPRKKLTTLETYAVTQTKSPLVIAGESSGSRSSPGGIQADVADDSSSAQGTSSTAVAAERSEGQASEFSGLVSYFSSQHDDYNT